MPRTNTEKLKALEHLLRGFSAIAIAYSGGLDSRLLSHIALKSGVDTLLVHASGPHLTRKERRAVADGLAVHPCRSIIVPADPLTMDEVARNGQDRCYHCKKFIFARLHEASSQRILCDGSNASDAKEYRPGHRALKEMAITSPFMQLGITKKEIRTLARLTGLPEPDQPASPCLLTRFAYDIMPDKEMMERIGAAEDALRSLNLYSFRLRVTDNARPPQLYIDKAEEVAYTAKQPLIHATLHRYGFRDSPVILTDTVSGMHDKQRGLGPVS
ncbi:hypothetical protein [Oleidesulfovibrio sp.]|uniref:hypothetical protein n=1 Tax=Oleidesulfovibrio sp. TaxID=2909707 RepID=UPI003A83F51D